MTTVAKSRYPRPLQACVRAPLFRSWPHSTPTSLLSFQTARSPLRLKFVALRPSIADQPRVLLLLQCLHVLFRLRIPPDPSSRPGEVCDLHAPTQPHAKSCRLHPKLRRVLPLMDVDPYRASERVHCPRLMLLRALGSAHHPLGVRQRSEERRVGKEDRSSD